MTLGHGAGLSRQAMRAPDRRHRCPFGKSNFLPNGPGFTYRDLRFRRRWRRPAGTDHTPGRPQREDGDDRGQEAEGARLTRHRV